MNKKRFYLNQTFVLAFYLLSLLLIWELVANWLYDEQSLKPSSIFYAFSNLIESNVLDDVGDSLRRVLIGYFVACIVSIALLVIIVFSPRIEYYIRTPLDLVSSIPPIAWTPIAILWFGIGDVPAYFIVFLGCFFPLFLGFYSAFKNVPKEYIDTAKVYGATNYMNFMEVRLPAMLPRMMTALKTALMIGWFNVIAAELIGVSSGLGYRIQLSRTLLFIDEVVALMVIIGILGWALKVTLELCEFSLVSWSRDDYKASTKALSINRVISKYLKIFKGVNHKVESLGSIKDVPNLEVINLGYSYNGGYHEENSEVIREITFSLHSNSVLAIIGQNGCGKTTLLNCIAGINLNFSGSVKFNGKNIEGVNSNKIIVFQDFKVFPWMTVYGNLDFVFRCSGLSENRVSVKKWLEKVDLWKSRELFPHQISGGMKQKLAVTRALSISPQLMLLDEPFANFDPIVRTEMSKDIRRLINESNSSSVIVTHDIEEAILVADKVIVMRKTAGEPLLSIDISMTDEERIKGTRSQKLGHYKNILIQALKEV